MHFNRRSNMFQSIHSIALYGMDGIPVRVEADVRDGFPSFEMLGYLSCQVREAGGRVKAALHNSGYVLEPKRICINLAPANVKKEGNAFDLPIAVAILASMIKLPEEKLNDTMFVGELGLDGAVKRIPGILPMVCAAREKGLKYCIVPKENVREASVLPGIRVAGAASLRQVVQLLTETEQTEKSRERIEASDRTELMAEETDNRNSSRSVPDFADVCGQQGIKRAIEVAVSGRHNLLMIGSAGSGKTMLARRIPGIMPPMTREEQLEVSRLYSAAGLLNENCTLVTERPFRAPHHTLTRTALTGGGRIPRAGEISLAHLGVLFLDELPEFQTEVIEALRQPMEERRIILARAYGTIIYPADFLTVAAMNPCRCGHYPDRNRCRCNEAQVRKYLGRISGPMLDRMDLVASVEPLSWQELLTEKEQRGELSAVIRERVARSWQIQRERLAGEGITFNSQMNQKQTEKFCILGIKERQLLQEAFDRFGISARVYHKILKTARTIADMEASEKITEGHLSEAIHYRSVVRRFWE